MQASDQHGTLQACVAPENQAAVAQRNDLTCVEKQLEEIKNGSFLSLSKKLQGLAAQAGFFQGFYEGAAQEIRDTVKLAITLVTKPDEVASSIAAVFQHPPLLLEALHTAGKQALENLVAFVCAPSYETGRAAGNLMGRITIMVLGAKGAKEVAKAVAESDAAAKAAGLGELGAIGNISVIDNDLFRGVTEAWRKHKDGHPKLDTLSHDGKLLYVVRENLLGKDNNQLVLRILNRPGKQMRNSKAIARKMALELAGTKKLPKAEPAELFKGKETGFPGEEPVLYKIPAENGEVITLRNFGGSIDESGPAWTIDIPKEMRPYEQFKEIKIERVPQEQK
ncbi:hypothetical protein HFU84_09260 [Acidithiobacillus sp. CV18-2]|nr:hypothetical protein [Acidithiobacillus sp. CV18-3]MBU2756073.1 hypothetical protein [Acidithiobacillus sp. BN09-2]MBU2777689.1 hypothetical protein [Acidithiobacillus sp. CV18-2]MBU2799209.1 hypothetical protein [Acidithiobacillus sp. VAN18-4]